MKNKVTHEHCIGMRGNERPTETSNLFFTLSLYCKYKTTVAMGKERIEKKEKKKKKANTNVERERERERERVTYESTMSKMFCNCVGNLVVRRINKSSNLSIFLLL